MGGKTTAQELCEMCCEVGLNQKAIKGDIPGESDKVACLWNITTRSALKILISFKKDYEENFMAIFW